MKRPRFRLVPPPTPTERQVAAGCKAVMERRGYKPVRLNTGLFWTKDGRPAPQGEPGLPDYAGIHRLYPGIFLEVKRPGCAPSPEQEAYHQELKIGYGLVVAVIDDAMALEAWLDAHESEVRKKWGADH